jgi:mRNA-degrading endonuclease RelE of RelBE toxin-antitoxin system
MMLALSVEDRFHSDLLGLPKDQQKKVLKAISDLRRDPAHLSKPLEGLPGVWRRRVDPYRVLFTKAPGWVHVYSVQHRQGVYHGQITTPRALPVLWELTLPKFKQGAITDLAEEGPDEKASQAVGDPWDIVWRVVDCRSDDDVLGLIDAGVPDGIIDRLVVDIKSRQHDARPSGHVQLIRQNVLDAFFGRLVLLGDQSAQDLIIAAPWLTAWSGPKSSLDGLVRYLVRRPVRTTILTRPPEMIAHKLALDRLRAVACVQVVHVPGLHAKFFVCDVAPIPFALVASANTTAKSYSNWEVGVLVRGAGDAETFIRELQDLATDLIAAGKLNKRRSPA